MLAVLMGRAGLPEGRADLWAAGVPAYIFPESAARSLAAMYRYSQWLERPAGEERFFDVDRETGAAPSSPKPARRAAATSSGTPCWRCSMPTASPRCARAARPRRKRPWRRRGRWASPW
jgi:acyl-CoA synthetase (NDP forming)